MSISLWSQPQTTIEHLTVRYSGSQESVDKTTLRLRVERLLDNADLRPPGLSSGAVLIVRRLNSPAALDVPALSQTMLPGWQASLRDQLAALYACAARPESGQIPSNAPAVLFADPGEMLACLTQDLLSGRAGDRWYWRQALHGRSLAPSSALPVLWCEHAAFLPAVLAALRPSEALNAITQLAPHAIEQVIHSLHESFDLDALAAIVSRRTEDQPSTRAALHSQVPGGETATASPPAAHTPPWEHWLPTAVPPTISPEANYLLGLALALHHAPSFARSTSFAAQSAAWLQQAHEGRSTMPIPPHPTTGHDSMQEASSQSSASSSQYRADEQLASIAQEAKQERARSNDTGQLWEQQAPLLPGTEPAPVARDSDGNRPVATSSAREAQRPTPAQEVQRAASSSPPDERSGELEVSQTRETPQSLERQAALQQVTPASVSHVASSDSAETPSQSPAPGSPGTSKAREFVTGTSKGLPADGVFTRLGGVLYLINVLTGLNMLHCWEQDEPFAERLSGWAIVEVLARGLLSLGRLHDGYVQDPIWQALAPLDGREPGAPLEAGDLFNGEEFRLPAAWLRRYGSDSWSAIQDDERLLLYDGVAGFLIADVPLQGRSFFEAAHAEVEAYHEQGLEAHWPLGAPGVLRRPSHEALLFAGIEEMTLPLAANDLLASMDEGVLWWLAHVLGFVYYLLARALGVSLGEPARLAELALCQHGQLIVTPTHIDLHMSMEEINIAARIAGLDRDPGWVPDLARIVYFHFD